VEKRRRAEVSTDLEKSEKENGEEASHTAATQPDKDIPSLGIGTRKLEPLTALTLPLTKYEKSRIVGARALQISLGAPILIQIPREATDPISMAEFELKALALPITIRRKLPGGRSENIPLTKLATEWL
jgi:DNA-directed RNA polymerase I, II, and III subunit RPABC2